MQGNSQILLEDFQAGFYESRARFPGFVSGWGTGKTMVGIFKGITLSTVYTNNLGLIVRKKFTDLRDSTLKDFELYTGLKVPMSTKEITVPGTNSVIMFRHGDELSGLQNVNLGWFLIEQSEEFETKEQFDLLRGRLRRILSVNKGFTADEFKEYIEYLKSNPSRVGMVIANANGHNWIWRDWISKPQPEHEIHQATTFDNIDNLPADFVADLRTMKATSEAKYNRYVLNSHEEIEIEGAIYGKWMDDAMKSKRITNVPHDPAAMVNTAWDIGIGDSTAIWFFQEVGQEVHLIDYYETCGESISHYKSVLEQKRRERSFNYGTHYGPFDLGKRELSTGRTIQQTASNLGIQFEVLARSSIEGSIELVRQMFGRFWFDENYCKDGIDAVINHRWRKVDSLSTEERSVFADMPLHDWTSHGADALKYLAQAVGKSSIGGLSVEDIHRLQKKYRVA